MTIDLDEKSKTTSEEVANMETYFDYHLRTPKTDSALSVEGGIMDNIA